MIDFLSGIKIYWELYFSEYGSFSVYSIGQQVLIAVNY